MNELVHLNIRTPKDDETSIEAATQIFSSLLVGSPATFFDFLFGKQKNYSFEIFLLDQRIYFYVTVPKGKETLIKSLLHSSYPSASVVNTTDPFKIVMSASKKEIGELVLNQSFYLPLRTYKDFQDVDPLSSLIGFLSKQKGDVRIGIQLLVTPPNFDWQKRAVEYAQAKILDENSNSYRDNPAKSVILGKAAFHGGRVAIRIITASKDNVPLDEILSNVASTYGVFSIGEGNQLTLKRAGFFKSSLIERMHKRTFSFFERRSQILNVQELATLWHPPGKLLSGIKNIIWGKSLAGEPPDNLPVAWEGMALEEKREINFFAKTEFKNKERVFGIKTKDRRKHVYIIGKTGAGKSTLIANMAIDDIRKGRGVGIIDPHGDLAETILDYIPKKRINDVVYLEPFDTERPFALNVLEIKNKQHKDLVASGIVSIFYKLYGHSWGPRLEYILRNVILTLLEVENATLLDVLKILSNSRYRKKVIEKLQDPVLRDFWLKEFATMSDRLRSEAVSPIQNKVGQFVSSRMIRNIIGRPKSSINLEEIINEGKILILNLSQGKLGEDNSALLGAMIITQIQLAAMNRAYIPEEERKDFFLFVDEFQNFATKSFIKILSEARKYRLSLTLANQYIDQIDEEVQKAIFGNVGTLISFIVGYSDADILSREFGGIYTEKDLVSLGKFEIVLKLSIDDTTSSPFPAKTLPLPSLRNGNKEKIIRVSKERYGRKIKK